MTTTLAPDLHVLSDEMLERFAARAPVYDAENRFFTEDFEELREAGYLLLAVPTELGGLGANLAQVCADQRHLARYAPATALATDMHLYWTGVAADLYRAGDTSLRWLLEEAVAGEVFGSGHGEAGNDLALLLSTTRAERADGGWRFYGRKHFGSLTPVWTRLGVHAMDASDPAAPVVVHAFIDRDAPGYSIVETWDTLGMRATRSDDTVLDGVFVADDRVARVVQAGLAGADAFVLGIFTWAEPTFASVYLGIADRALELALSGAGQRTSIALAGRAMAWHPYVQHAVADMVLELDAATALVERVAQDWSNGVDHGGWWPAKLVSAKHRATEAAKRVVDLAMGVPVLWAKGSVPQGVPAPGRLPAPALPPRDRRGLLDRDGPRPVLPRVLLGTHAGVVHGRGGQPSVDGGAHRSHGLREDRAGRRTRRGPNRNWLPRLGRPRDGTSGLDSRHVPGGVSHPGGDGTTNSSGASQGGPRPCGRAAEPLLPSHIRSPADAVFWIGAWLASLGGEVAPGSTRAWVTPSGPLR